MPLELDVMFAGSRLDRRSDLRGDAAALAARAADPGARALALWHGKPLFARTAPGPALVWLPLSAPVLAEAAEPPVFLGELDGAPRFAADVSAWADPAADPARIGSFLDMSENRHPSLPEDHVFIDLRAHMGVLAAGDAAEAGVAKALLGWHATHRFCARCGEPSRPAQAGWQRDCPACGAHHFPRTDPVAIVLATHGDRVLLGRSPGWPPAMFSLLAGFLEPGETLEQGAAREVFEEAGVRLTRLRILVSQPWPFPTSLMVGIAGVAADPAITLDRKELEEARWVGRQEMMEVLAGLRPDLKAARRGSIARTLLEAWTAGRIVP